MTEIAISNETQMTVGQIVARNFRTADVFKKHKIDFCCKGHKLLSEACSDRNVDLEVIEAELQQAGNARENSAAAMAALMPLDVLASYIEEHHHRYVREQTPLLLEYLTKVNKVHGRNHPELNEILMRYIGCVEDLTSHMVREESVLFPAIKRLAAADRAGETIDKPFFFGSLSNPIGTMEREHAAEGDRVMRITHLTNDFTPPEDACTTYRVAFQKLNDFVNDLYTHIHLENNILFPRALALEAAIVKVSDN